MGKKSGKSSKGGKPEEQRTSVSTAQARDSENSRVEQPVPSINSQRSNAANAVNLTTATPSNEASEGIPPHSSENKNATGAPATVPETVQQPSRRPQQVPTILRREVFNEIQSDLESSATDAQKSNTGSSKRSGGSVKRSGRPNSRATGNARSVPRLERHRPSPILIPSRRIGGSRQIVFREELPPVPPTTASPTTVPPTTAHVPHLHNTPVQALPRPHVGPSDSCRSPASLDGLSPSRQSCINPGLRIGRSMDFLQCPQTPRMIYRRESPVSPPMTTEMLPHEGSPDLPGAGQQEQALAAEEMMSHGTPQRADSESDFDCPFFVPNADSEPEMQFGSNGGLHVPPQKVLDADIEIITPQPPQTPRPLTPLPQTTLQFSIRPQTPRRPQTPQPPGTPQPLPALSPTRKGSHSRHSSSYQDPCTARNMEQNVHRDVTGSAKSTQTPPQRIRMTRAPNEGFNGLGRPPMIPPIPRTPRAPKVPQKSTSRISQTEPGPSQSLPAQANTSGSSAPPVTARDRPNSQTLFPFAVNAPLDHRHIANMRSSDQEANQSVNTEQGPVELTLTGGNRERDETDISGERRGSEQEERRELRISTPSCKPPKDPRKRKEDDDSSGGAAGDQNIRKVLPGLTRTSVKRSHISKDEPRKRQPRSRGRTQNCGRDKICENSKDQESNGPNQTAEIVLNHAPSTSADRSRKYNLQPEMLPVSHAELVQSNFEHLTTRQGRKMKNMITPPDCSANRSAGSLDTRSMTNAHVEGSKDVFIREEEIKRGTEEVQAAGSVPTDLHGDRSDDILNAPVSDGNSRARNGTLVPSRHHSPNERDASQVSAQINMKRKTSSPRGGRDSPEVEAWLEEPRLPKPRSYSNEHVIRSKHIIFYETGPKPARSHNSGIPTPQRDEPSAAERQERLRLYQARLRRRETAHSAQIPANGQSEIASMATNVVNSAHMREQGEESTPEEHPSETANLT